MVPLGRPLLVTLGLGPIGRRLRQGTNRAKILPWGRNIVLSERTRRSVFATSHDLPRSSDDARTVGLDDDDAVWRDGSDVWVRARCASGLRMSWLTIDEYFFLCRSDVTLAYKTILRAVEMATDPGDALIPETRTESASTTSSDLSSVLQCGGWRSRVWWDLKLVSRSLSRQCPQLIDSLSIASALHLSNATTRRTRSPPSHLHQRNT